MLNSTDNTPSVADHPQSPGITTRRTLALGGMATAIAEMMSVMPIDPATAANANEDGSDLVLIQFCSRIVAARKEQSSLQQVMYDLLPADPAHDVTFSRIQVLSGRADKLARQAAKLPAWTPRGIQARAAAVHAMQPIDFDINDWAPLDWHQGMLDALLRDVMGRA